MVPEEIKLNICFASIHIDWIQLASKSYTEFLEEALSYYRESHRCCNTNKLIESRISTEDAPWWETWTELTHKYLKLLCNFWLTHSILGIRLTVSKRIHILNATIDYIRLTKRFDEPLFWIMRFFSFFIYISKFQVPGYKLLWLQVPA